MSPLLLYVTLGVSIWEFVYSTSVMNKYERNVYLDGYRCNSEYLVFNITNVVSKIKCLAICSKTSTCTAVAYRPSTKECIACRFGSTTGNAEVFENSLFYENIRCPASTGMLHYDENFQLMLYTQKHEYPEATAECERINGHLVMLDEEWKVGALSAILKSCQGYNTLETYWVDGTKNGNKWLFSDTRHMAMDEYTFWEVGEPDALGSSGPESCVIMKYKYQRYRLNSSNCNTLHGFICEF